VKLEVGPKSRSLGHEGIRCARGPSPPPCAVEARFGSKDAFEHVLLPVIRDLVGAYGFALLGPSGEDFELRVDMPGRLVYTNGVPSNGSIGWSTTPVAFYAHPVTFEAISITTPRPEKAQTIPPPLLLDLIRAARSPRVGAAELDRLRDAGTRCARGEPTLIEAIALDDGPVRALAVALASICAALSH